MTAIRNDTKHYQLPTIIVQYYFKPILQTTRLSTLTTHISAIAVNRLSMHDSLINSTVILQTRSKVNWFDPLCLTADSVTPMSASVGTWSFTWYLVMLVMIFICGQSKHYYHNLQGAMSINHHYCNIIGGGVGFSSMQHFECSHTSSPNKLMLNVLMYNTMHEAT